VQAYILRRLLFGVLIVWGVYTLTFFAVNLAPGDPFANLENPKMQKEDLDRLRHKWGYDRPVLERYLLQLRKTFWADAEVLTFESQGIELSVFAMGDGNGVSARVQVPADTVTLAPTEVSRLEGAEPVVLERRGDAWGPRPIRPGTYLVGRARFVVREDGVGGPFATGGLTLEAASGEVHARPTLDAAPEHVVLESSDGRVELPRAADGTFGPLALKPDRYRYGERDVVVPPEQLEPGGLTFDLGTSISHREPVMSYLASPLKNTLILALTALLLDFTLGIFIGVVGATRPNTKLDHGLTLGSLFVYSMPGFWLALMLVLLFSVKLDWLPSEGMHDPNTTGFLDLLEHLVLPAFVLGIAAAASTARYQRSALLEVMSQDYIRTARAKGLDERTVIWKHAMRNSLLPVITLIGLSLPFLVSGAVITETIFSWPGMGRAVIEAIRARDVFVITGVTLISTTLVVIGNLLADILYALVDPRVRLR